MRAQWRQKVLGNRKRKLAQREKIEKEEITHNRIRWIPPSLTGVRVSCLGKDFQLFRNVNVEVVE